MTEAEWRDCGQPQRLFRELLEPGRLQRTKAGKRKLRLLACGCSRLFWDLLTDERSRHAVEVAERLADGQASEIERAAAFQALQPLTHGGYLAHDPGVRERTAAAIALSCLSKRAASTIAMTMYEVALPSREVQCCLIRDVFNPFHSAPVSRGLLAWNDRTIPKLAQPMYDDRAFDRLPILADAVEEAGGDEALVAHLRSPRPHVRGCWALDLLLGKA